MTTGRKILIVDDDLVLGAMLGEFLSGEGFQAEHVASGPAALRAVAARAYDLVILDVMMPRMDGLEVLRRLRREGVTPVMLLTARGEDDERILGLDLGADDYLSKPFNPRELAARVRAILRRSEGLGAPGGAPLAVGPLIIDPATMTVTLKGDPVRLTTAEFTVLEALVRSAGRVQSRAALTYQALGRPLEPFDRSIDTHVSNIRRKLQLTPGGAIDIRGFRGHGYVLNGPAAVL